MSAATPYFVVHCHAHIGENIGQLGARLSCMLDRADLDQWCSHFPSQVLIANGRLNRDFVLVELSIKKQILV